jgi:Ca-activated chloride channel family protein
MTAVGAPDGDYTNYTTLSAGASPVELLLLDAPGDYEIRYVQNQSRTVLARIPITTTPVEATLEAPESATTESAISVTWTGPNYGSDYITIVAAGAPDSAYLSYANTRNGNPSSITAPAAAGEYELRYVLGQSRTVAARRSVTVAAP